MAKKIFFGNYKGGVGKTTTIFEIGAHLTEDHGKKVLLIDLDPQCSLSRICSRMIDLDLQHHRVNETLNYALEVYGEYGIYTTRLSLLEGIMKTNYKGIEKSIKTLRESEENKGRLDFIPSILDVENDRLNEIAERLSKRSTSIITISKLIEDIEENNEYDYILFDCPPTTNIITQGIFLKCDYYLIPTIGDGISSDGVIDYIGEIVGTYSKYAYDSSIGGMVMKMYFGEEPKLIGILQTMTRLKEGTNTSCDILRGMSNLIIQKGIKSLIYNTSYAEEEESNLFKEKVRHLNGASNSKHYGIPKRVYEGELHEEYKEITRILLEVLE
ncbi:MAG: ParA family protein [Clostridium sp.]